MRPWRPKADGAEMVLIPILDVLQSVPILGYLSFTVVFFVSLFPGNVLGPELATIFAIFTSLSMARGQCDQAVFELEGTEPAQFIQIVAVHGQPRENCCRACSNITAITLSWINKAGAALVFGGRQYFAVVPVRHLVVGVPLSLGPTGGDDRQFPRRLRYQLLQLGDGQRFLIQQPRYRVDHVGFGAPL
jgi:hypothetical protein